MTWEGVHIIEEFAVYGPAFPEGRAEIYGGEQEIQIWAWGQWPGLEVKTFTYENWNERQDEVILDGLLVEDG